VFFTRSTINVPILKLLINFSHQLNIDISLKKKYKKYKKNNKIINVIKMDKGTKSANEKNEGQRRFKLFGDQAIQRKKIIILPINSERISQAKRRIN